MATTSLDPATGTSTAGFETEEILGYTRSASDVLRLLVYGAVALVLLAVTRYAQDAVLGFERDFVSALGFLEPPAERVLEGVAQLLALVVGIGILVVPFLLKRFRLLGYLILANIVAGSLLEVAIHWLDRDEPKQIANELSQRGGLHLHGSITGSGIAALASSFVILGPFVGNRWRRAGAVLLAVFVALRILLSVELPAEVFLALAIGAAVGVATLLAFGRPDQHPTGRAVANSLAAAGLTVTELVPVAVSRRGSRNFLAPLDDGGQLLVKVRSPQERSADVLFRLYRYLRLKNVGDERPFTSLRRAVEHEALVSLQARDAGVRTPRMRAIAEVGNDSMLLAFEHVEGATLHELEGDDIGDDLLDSLWAQVGILRVHRIAHRDLRRANIVVDPSGGPWIVDFGFSEVAVGDDLLDADVAQLLAALALQVGAARAVDSALRVVGVDAVRSSLRLLQLNALSGPTRTALRQRKGLLKELQTTVAQRCNVDQPEFTPLARLDRRAVLTIVMLVLAVYFLLPQFSDLPGIVDQVKEAHWIWFGPVILASVLTYAGATFGMLGSIPERLRFAPTFVAQVASSFAGTLAPASVGGMALNARYLQKSGVDPAVAVPAVGLNAVAGLGMHVALLSLFIIWAGKSAFGSIIPAIRHALRDRLVPIVKRSASGLFAVVRRPRPSATRAARSSSPPGTCWRCTSRCRPSTATCRSRRSARST